MSDELTPQDETLDYDAETLDAGTPEAGEEYEEISSDEVDRVVAALEDLIETVESENVRLHLEEALNDVYYLVYDENDAEAEDDDDVALGEAA